MLTPSKEHDNAYVRSGAAGALAEAVDHLPQTIGTVLTRLEGVYHEKVELLEHVFYSGTNHSSG